MTAGSDGLCNHAAFIWSVADLLRGDYKQSECGRVILPLTVLRRLDCVLEPSKAKVLERHAKHGDRDDKNGQFEKKTAFLVRVISGTKELEGVGREKYIAGRWPHAASGAAS